MKVIGNFLKFTRKLKRSCKLNLWRSFLLVETICFSGNCFFELKLYSFQGKPFLQWEPFLLVETIPFSGSHSFQKKLFLLVEAIPFGGSYSSQWKSFLLVEAIFFINLMLFKDQLIAISKYLCKPCVDQVYYSDNISKISLQYLFSTKIIVMRTDLFWTLQERCRKQPSGNAFPKQMPFQPILDFDNKLMQGIKNIFKFFEDINEGVQFGFIKLLLFNLYIF